MQRCRLYKVPLVDPERAIDDPALALMLSEGWTIVASFLAEERDARFLVFVLMPPYPKRGDLVVRDGLTKLAHELGQMREHKPDALVRVLGGLGFLMFFELVFTAGIAILLLLSVLRG